MSFRLDRDDVRLQASALRQALDRLRTLGLIDDDASTASAALTRLIVEAMARGERNEENLVLYAMGRFQPLDKTRKAVS